MVEVVKCKADTYDMCELELRMYRHILCNKIVD